MLLIIILLNKLAGSFDVFCEIDALFGTTL